MIKLIECKEFDRYKTIWTKDLNMFFKMVMNKKMFNQYNVEETNYSLPRWSVVHDENKIKDTLIKKFSSAGRDGYIEGKPSTTVITSTLFPVDLKKELFKLSWLNNIKVEVLKESEEYNLQSMRLGTYCHLIIELYLRDTRPYQDRDIESIIVSARNHKVVKKHIKDFDDNIVLYEETALKTLAKFLKEDICKYDCIGSEIYFNNEDLQGSVDYVGMKDGRYCVNDWKTTRKTYKNTGSRKFSSKNDINDYVRQSCSYVNNLILQGVIPLEEKYNIDCNIFQFHLLSHEYKLFDLDIHDVLSWEKEIKIVEDWYWRIMNG